MSKSHNPKNQNPEAGEQSGLGKKSIIDFTTLSEKECELLRILGQNTETPRRIIEPAIGSAYCPNEVRFLRGIGFEIPCREVKSINRYGKPTRYGLYRLTPADSVLAAKYLKEE